ncbi:MAG: dTDP-glucose 4,6-dehydratase, partial [Phycisphaerales bacterium]
RSNLELTKMLIELCGRDETAIEHVPDRLGHDKRYAIDASKIKRELGWEPTRSAWPEALEQTVQWYKDNRTWCDHVRSGEYRRFYEQNYASRA